MSPDAPEKQSRYRILDISPLAPAVHDQPGAAAAGRCRPQPPRKPAPRNPLRRAATLQSRAVLLETVVAGISQHHVVQHVDAHDGAGLHQARRQGHVVLARRGIPRRMVVKHDYRGRAARGSHPEHLPRMRQRLVQRADRQQRREQHAVTRIELHDAELLHRPRAVPRQQVARHVARPAQPGPLVGQRERAAAQFDGGRDPGRHGRSDAGNPLQLALQRARQPVYPTGMEEYAVRDVERALVLGSVTDYRGEQLVVAEPGRAQAPQLLAGPIVQSQLSYAHAVRSFNLRAALRPIVLHAGPPCVRPLPRKLRQPGSGQRWRQHPATVRDDVGPSRELNLLAGPVDALRAARRHDLRTPRGAAETGRRNGGRARAGARRRRGPHAALPDEDPNPIGTLDRGELHVGPFRKPLVRRQEAARGAGTAVPLLPSTATTRRTAGCRRTARPPAPARRRPRALPPATRVAAPCRPGTYSAGAVHPAASGSSGRPQCRSPCCRPRPPCSGRRRGSLPQGPRPAAPPDSARHCRTPPPDSRPR